MKIAIVNLDDDQKMKRLQPFKRGKDDFNKGLGPTTQKTPRIWLLSPIILNNQSTPKKWLSLERSEEPEKALVRPATISMPYMSRFHDFLRKTAVYMSKNHQLHSIINLYIITNSRGQ